MNKSFLILVSVLILTFTGHASAQNPVKYNKELDGFDYPFEVNTFEFDSQKQTLKMRYMDIGNKDAEKVVVLLHGKNFAGFYWEDVANDLVSKKYRVLIPDQIGFGKSSKPDAYQYSLGQFALNTKLLLESLKIDNITLVGHSDKARAYQQKIYYAGKWSKEYETLLVPLKGMLAGDDWKVVAWNNALTYGPIFSENIVDRFPQIQSKTYLINGTRDTTGPGRGWLKEGVTRKLGEYTKLGKHTQSLIKDSVLIELEGLGHMPFYEDYPAFIKAFNQAMD